MCSKVLPCIIEMWSYTNGSKVWNDRFSQIDLFGLLAVYKWFVIKFWPLTIHSRTNIVLWLNLVDDAWSRTRIALAWDYTYTLSSLVLLQPDHYQRTAYLKPEREGICRLSLQGKTLSPLRHAWLGVDLYYLSESAPSSSLGGKVIIDVSVTVSLPQL